MHDNKKIEMMEEDSIQAIVSVINQEKEEAAEAKKKKKD